MNVLALFDGMSCGRITLDVMGVTPTKYYASEIDPFAIKASMACFPDTIQIGSVTEWRTWEINWASIDLLIGGSPCQGFSSAGKQAGTTAIHNGEKVIVDTREKYLELKAAGAEFLSQSYLFWEYILCLDHVKACNPKVKFFLENVKMKKEFLQLITDAMGVEPVFINSALVSAQNRQRYYWCNWHVEQPDDKGIVLADIIEDNFVTDREKSYCIDANYYKGGSPKNYFEKSRRQLVFDTPQRVATASDIKGYDYNKRIYSASGKSPTLAAGTGGNLKPKVLIANENPRTVGITENERGFRPHQGDKPKSGISELGRILKTRAKTDAITASHMPKVALNSDVKNLMYRKLTPRECGRLQTVPEHIIDKIIDTGISNTQIYKMFGNGWTIDVIVHIFSGMELPVQVFARQLELFGGSHE